MMHHYWRLKRASGHVNATGQDTTHLKWAIQADTKYACKDDFDIYSTLICTYEAKYLPYASLL